MGQVMLNGYIWLAEYCKFGSHSGFTETNPLTDYLFKYEKFTNRLFKWNLCRFSSTNFLVLTELVRKNSKLRTNINEMILLVSEQYRIRPVSNW